ncbi:MAG: TetR/AcrR family transcriptional regulator [Oscillospiraceae bacterium]|nr:TetR/AcrR family transcriptional regulator [Oscillospiraceae bacterium]
MKNKNNKRELILEAVKQLMSEVRYKDISVSDIARKAGIGKGSIYYYFESKDEMLREIIERSYRLAINKYLDSVDSQMSALQKIKHLFRSIIREEFDDREYNFILTLIPDNDMLLQNMLKYIAIKEISPILADILEQGIEEGTITTDTPRESAEIVIAVLTFLLDYAVFPKDDSDGFEKKLKIFAGVLETCFKTEQGGFDFLLDIHDEYT